MPATESCQPCCAETQTVNTPGPEGDDGNNGTDGANAFSESTADFVIPAIGDTVTVALDQSLWMVDGQIVVFEGPATFRVTSLPSATSAELEFLGYAGDLSPGGTIVSGSQVSPSGAQPELSTLSVYASGTAYQLTNTPALLDFGTTDPSLTITSPGTWLIFGRVRYDYTGATFAAVRTVTTKLRRTNNSATDLSNSSAGWATEIITTLTYTAMILDLQPIVYTTVNSDDILQLWGDVNIVPSAGSLDAVEASIIAIKLS